MQKTVTQRAFENVKDKRIRTVTYLLQPLLLMSVFILMCLQREPAVRVLDVPSPPPLRYFSVSKGGQTTVWSISLHALRRLGVSACCSPSVDWQGKQTSKRFRGWTTDAVSMANAHKVAIATDCTDLHFINVSMPACLRMSTCLVNLLFTKSQLNGCLSLCLSGSLRSCRLVLGASLPLASDSWEVLLRIPTTQSSLRGEFWKWMDGWIVPQVQI